MKIKKNIVKIWYPFFILSIVLMIGACTATYKANKLYEKGEYLQSVRTITKELDKKNEWPAHKPTAQKTLNIINGSIRHFEQQRDNSNSHDFDNNIYAYKGLLEIRQLLNNKFYSNHFSDFINTYNIAALKQNVAQQYYLKGNSIKPVAIIDYKIKSDLYKEGLNYAEYKDMRTLQQKYAKQYATLAAADFYKKGQEAAKAKEYKSASEFFAQAREVYKDYGAYKDSHQQFVKHDKIWRTNAAGQVYDQAQNKATYARYKSDHRQISALYLEAYNYYKPYGNFKNAQELYQKHLDQGMIYITTRISGSSTNWEIERLIKKQIEDKFHQSYYKKAESGGRRDLEIDIYYKTYYEESKEKRHSRPMQHTDASGNILNFTEHTVEKYNHYRVEVKISASGRVYFSDQFTAKASSYRSEITYSGNVPSNYNNQKQGSFKSKYDLENEVEKELEYKIRDMLSSIYYKAERL